MSNERTNETMSTGAAGTNARGAVRVGGGGRGRAWGWGALLRRVSGQPVGMTMSTSGGERRGSFLVLVVGTLAILAVITIAYVAIGNQDSRRRGALEKQQALDDVPQQFADYVGGVLADDVLATQLGPQLPPSPGLPVDSRRAAVRETADYPSTLWDKTYPVSSAGVVSVQTEYDRFDPAGTVNPKGNLGGPRTDAIPGSDPFIASTSPVYLDTTQALRTGAEGRLYDPLAPLAGRYELYRDWMHITNVAPDGIFVNLGNLAPLKAAGDKARTPNLTAAAGFGKDAAGFNRMSEGLTLIGDPPIAAGDGWLIKQNGPVVTTTGSTALGLPLNIEANRRRIAVWDSYQRGAFRPTTDTGSDAAGDPLKPNQAGYAPFEWADADGDGFFDSRWFSLVDSRNPNAPVSFIKADPRYRYFFAARVVDLSALVNVNTAGDFRMAPNANAPVGLTPADIDLLRLLLVRAGDEQFAPAAATVDERMAAPGLAYDGIPQPLTNTKDVRSIAATSLGPAASNYGPEPDPTPETIDTPPSAPVAIAVPHGYNVGRAERVGHYGYLSLALSRAASLPAPLVNPTSTFTGSIYAQAATFRGPMLAEDDRFGRASSFRVFAGLSDPASTPGAETPRQKALDAGWNFAPLNLNLVAGPPPASTATPEYRADWYLRQARSQYGSTVSTPEGFEGSGELLNPRRTADGRFGVEDLAELLKYRGVNDPTTTSSLERVLGGRDVAMNASGPAFDTNTPATYTSAYSPLRDNRPLTVELTRDRVTNGPGEESATREGQPIRDGVADRKAMLQAYVDVRQHLTTVSGARLLRNSPGAKDRTDEFKPGVNPDRLDANELRIDATALLDGTGRALPALYQGYADALLPMSYIPASWGTPISGAAPSADFFKFRTLFYGHNGAELANLVAASMAVNFSTLVGIDDPVNSGKRAHPPIGFALLQDDALNSDVSAADPYDALANEPVEPGQPPKRTLELPKKRKGDTGSSSAKPLVQALNVYGVAPQPFITGVQVYTVYTDAPGSSLDPSAGAGGSIGRGPSPDVPGTHPNIRANISAQNADFLFRMVAIQITNPSDQDITLSSSVPWNNPGDPTADATIRQYSATFGANKVTEWRQDSAAIDQVDPAMAGVGVTRDDDFYYIEIGGRFFKLAEAVECAADASSAGEAANNRLPANPLRHPSIHGPTFGPGEYVEVGPNIGRQPIALKPITIRAGRTIVAYALSQPPRQILKRFLNVEPSTHGAVAYPGLNTFASTADQNTQQSILGVIQGLIRRDPTDGPKVDQTDLKWILEFDPTTGRAQTFGTTGDGTASTVLNLEDSTINFTTDPNAPPSGSPGMINREVRLWRAIRTAEIDGEVQAVTVPGTGWDTQYALASSNLNLRAKNQIVNDQLVDRMRVPKGTLLDARLRFPGIPTGGDPNTIDQVMTASDLDAGKEWDPDLGSLIPGNTDPSWNRGLTLLVTAGVRRPSDPSVQAYAFGGITDASKWPIQPGMLPAYCLESKYRLDPNPPSTDIVRDGLYWNTGLSLPWRTDATASSELVPDVMTKLENRHFGLDASGSPFGSTNLLRVVGRTTLGEWVHYVSNRRVAAITGTAKPVKMAVFGAVMYPPDGRKSMIADLVAPTASTAPLRDVFRNSNGLPVPGSAGAVAGVNVDNMPYEMVAPSFSFNHGGFVRAGTFAAGQTRPTTLRGGDMLLPLGVAPFRTILVPGVGRVEPTDETAWTTLSEALCASLGYGQINPANMVTLDPDAKHDPIQLLVPRPDVTGDTTATRTRRINRRTLFDRGRLRLDDFVPFVDVQNPTGPSGAVTYGVFDYGTFGNADDRAWTGIPLALNVLDVFTGIPAASLPAPDGDPFRRVAPGVVNVNTAPIQVLRSLPMVSPRLPNLMTTTDRQFGAAWWWGTPAAGSSEATIQPTSDVATTMLAYRDRAPAYLRPASVQANAGMRWVSPAEALAGSTFPPDPRIPVSFESTRPGVTPALVTDPDYPSLESRRGFWADINGLSEDPGFHSTGELFCARMRLTKGSYGWSAETWPATTAPYQWYNPVSGYAGRSVWPDDWAMPGNMDFAGYAFDPTTNDPSAGKNGIAAGAKNRLSVSKEGVDSFKPASFYGSPASRPANKYEDQLAVLNALSNTVSTRSDYYACWFMVAGFQESDLTNLAAEDPVTPSVLRRFVVVYDRSNVKARGDKPRVMMMREVPVEAPR